MNRRDWFKSAAKAATAGIAAAAFLAVPQGEAEAGLSTYSIWKKFVSKIIFLISKTGKIKEVKRDVKKLRCIISYVKKGRRWTCSINGYSVSHSPE